jgi:hypothetical protein
MDELGVEVTELHETANLLLRRRHWPVCNGLAFLCRNGNFKCRHSAAQVLHLLKIEEAFLNTQLQAFLFEALKHKTKALEVFVEHSGVRL